MPPALKAALERCRALCLAALAGGAASLGGDAAVTAAVGPEAQTFAAAETAAWAQAQRAHTPEAYQRYLELFPVGLHAEEAFRRLIERSLLRRPVVQQLVDVEPALTPGGAERTRTVTAAQLAVY